MQKNKNTRLINAGDFLLGFFCLLGMVTALFLFWKDLNISFAKTNEPKIAVIYFKHNTAQRRLQDRNIWERLQQSSTIYNGDRIRTAADSEAYTIFNDGTRIDLHENTLIQVFDSKQGNNINFIDGAISVKSVSKEPSVTIHTAGKEISFEENTSATLSTSISNQVTAIVSTGTINVVEIPQQPKPKIDLDIDLFNAISKQNPEEVLDIINLEQPTSFVPKDDTQTKVTAGNIISFTVESESSTQDLSNTTGTPEVYLPTKTYSLMHDVDEIPFLPITWKSSVPISMIFSRTSNFSEVLKQFELPADKTNLIAKLDFTEPEETLYWKTISKDMQNENSIEQYQSGVIHVKLLQNMQLEESVKQAFGIEQAEVIQQQISDADIQMNKLLLENQNQTELPQEASVVSVPIVEVAPVAEVIPVVEVAPVVTPVPVKETPMAKTEPVKAKTTKVEPVKKTETVTKPVETVKKAEPTQKPVETVKKAEPTQKPVETVKKAEPTQKPVETVKKVEPEPAPKPIEKPAIISAKPVLTSPAKDKIFVEADFLTDNPQIEFIWDKIPEAQTYTFTLYSGETVLKTSKVEDSTFILKDEDLALLDNGAFKWSVTANQTVDKTEYNSILAESTFDVILTSIGNIEIDRSTLLNAE